MITQASSTIEKVPRSSSVIIQSRTPISKLEIYASFLSSINLISKRIEAQAFLRKIYTVHK